MTEEEHDRLLAEQQIMSEAGFRARQARELRHGSGPVGPTSSIGVPGPTGPTTIGPSTNYPADPVYDFEHLGTRIAESLILAAENQVVEANALLAQTKALSDSIREQVKIQTDALMNLNGRLKTFGQQMLDAHRKFNGDKHD